MVFTPTILVLGAGSWGTALAMVLARNGHQVVLWGRNSTQMQQMAAMGGLAKDAAMAQNMTQQQ